MPNLLTVPAGESIAHLSAVHILARHTPETLAQAVVFVPNRRSVAVMRDAFAHELDGKATLLPRFIPLADIGDALLGLIGSAAFEILEAIPVAMPLAQQRYILTQQVAIFERKHRPHVSLDYAMTMADALMELQENIARAGVSITRAQLLDLMPKNYAEHWRDAIEFLAILTDVWPSIEQEMGVITATAHELRVMEALATYWAKQPPAYAVYAVGSTASQSVTAQLLKTIAHMPQGAVILPGIDPTMDAGEWEAIAAGHPLFHLKQFLDGFAIPPANVTPLVNAPRSIWLEASVPPAFVPKWPVRILPDHRSLRLIPCAQPEEEVRVISLLLREALENPAQHVALITPDERLMAQVASHMKRYDITVDRLNAGTLASTQIGSLWAVLLAALMEPERQLPLRSLLHHPLMAIDPALRQGLEKGWHGLNRSHAGHLPRHDANLNAHPNYAALAAFVKQIYKLSSQTMSASGWVNACRSLLEAWVEESGQAHDAVEAELAAIAYADGFGAMPIQDFAALLTDRLATPWRDAGLNTHPRIHLLTPVEARLQRFDCVIFANMVDDLWPGMHQPNPWMNLAASESLGLPDVAERVSLMAHDVLMLGSYGEVFLTYPRRAGGSPTTRSRFIERLLTLLASHRIAEADITAAHYASWAQMLYASDVYAPEAPATPRPTGAQRPRRLPVTDIEKLVKDPFHIYAKHVLGLRKLDEIDASPEASDFGSLTHKAAEELSRHWDAEKRPATQSELAQMAQHALRELSERPSIDIFWRARLKNGLHYVNHLEAEHRDALTHVACEEKIEQSFPLTGNEAITLYGRIDRVETRNTGITIIDHKTGQPPSQKEILDGRAPQLLAYSMLLGDRVEAVQYWALPRLGTQGDITQAEITPEILAQFEAKLRSALLTMLDEATPFLARPNGGDDRFGGDYDGISRWDEWAG
jgi:ATP-dependent helicase/nuclease subunit B